MSPADVSVDLVVGTLGIGLQVAKLVMPHLAARVAAHYFSLNKTTTQSDVEYAADLKSPKQSPSDWWIFFAAY